MLFYYVQIKDRLDPGVNIRRKANVASVNKAVGSGEEEGGVHSETKILGGRAP